MAFTHNALEADTSILGEPLPGTSPRVRTAEVALLLVLEEGAVEPGLPNDREGGPDPQLCVIGDGNGPRRLAIAPLHADMASTAAHLDKAVPGEDATDVTPRNMSS